MPQNNSDTLIVLVIVIIAIMAISALMVGVVSSMNSFSRELRYLNREIKRSYGAERKHWLRRRRRLWLSLLPFVKY